jgi:hypothetical protein
MPMRPEGCAALALALLLTGGALAQDDDRSPWYQVEVIVFKHPGDSGLRSEQWPAEPRLTYPERARHLIDRELADARLAAFPGSRSRITEDGVQQLSLPQPRHYRPTPLLDPDADAEAPDIPRRDTGPLATEPDPVESTEDAQNAVAADGPVPMDPTRPDARLDPADERLPAPALTPFVALPESQFSLRQDAARLRSAGYELLWHQAWVQPAVAEGDSMAVIIDRSGDADSPPWPALQGSLRLHLSRYLHIDARIWLNTDGDYLHPKWRMPTPPRAPASVAMTLPDLSDWYRSRAAQRETESVAEGIEVSRPDARVSPADATGAQVDTGPWRHAILLDQQRRMRGGELHYLDHPVLGVLVRTREVDAERRRALHEATEDWRWDDRHQRQTPGR